MHGANIWKDRVEDDVLDCLEEAYYNVCYAVNNWHKIDRSHEEGVDIECQKPKQKIVLQAKIKPVKNDLEQLRKLSRSTANKRIYVYIRHPPASFKNEMENLKSTVEFWDSKNLHDFLIKYRSLLYLRFLFLSCDLVKDITKTLRDIFSCCEIDPRKLESLNLNDWWELKDRAVKIHTSLEYLENFWKEHIFTIDRHDTDEYRGMLESTLFSCKLISRCGSEDLVELVARIKDSHPNLFSEHVNVVLARSNWIGMGRVKREIRDRKQVIKLIHEWVIPLPRSNTEYSQINDYLENLREVAEAIEDGVDWLFDDYLKSQNLPTLR